MDSLIKAQRANSKFKRLYWCSNKEKINEILSRVNIKYLYGLKKKFQKSNKGTSGMRFYLRYSGYEFQVSGNTVNKAIYNRLINDQH